MPYTNPVSFFAHIWDGLFLSLPHYIQQNLIRGSALQNIMKTDAETIKNRGVGCCECPDSMGEEEIA